MAQPEEDGYKLLQNRVDAMCARLAQRYRKQLACRAGCSSCCGHHLSVFEVEAAMLRRAIARLPEAVRERLRAQASRAPQEVALLPEAECDRLRAQASRAPQEVARLPEAECDRLRVQASRALQEVALLPEAECDRLRAQASRAPQEVARLPEAECDRLRAQEVRAAGGPESCPLLLDDCCAVYGDRPIICRTQGLPLLIVADDGGLEVVFCPLNFTSHEAMAELEEEYLVPLERLNEELVLTNLDYCRAAGHADPGARTCLADIVAAAPQPPQGAEEPQPRA